MTRSIALRIGDIVLVTVVIQILACDRKADSPDPAMPPIEMLIPDNLPDDMEFTEANGTKYHANPRTHYQEAYKQGWEEYWNQFKSGQVALEDEGARPHWPQESGIEAKGRLAGFLNCRKKLLEIQRQREPSKSAGHPSDSTGTPIPPQ